MENSLGARIRILRENQNLTQQQLAERCNVSIHTISCWENGKTNPTVEHQKMLAKILHTTIDAFYIYPDQLLPPDVFSRQINDIMSSLTLDEQKFIIEIARGLLKLNHPE